MTKKFLAVSLLCMAILPGYLYAQGTKAELRSAIDSSNVRTVKKLLRRMGSELTQKDKKEFLETASKIADECEQSVSLLKSGWDLATFLGGVSLSGFGAYSINWLEKFLIEKQDNQRLKVELSMATSLILPGLYLTIKGWQCSSAAERLDAASKVEELMDRSVASETR